MTTFSSSFVKINDRRLLFTVTEDMVARNYPRLFDLNIVWQFSTRPLSKYLIEGFNDVISTEGKPLKLPLQSCVFCADGKAMSPNLSDDRAINAVRTLIGSETMEEKDYTEGKKKWIEQDQKEFMESQARELARELEYASWDKQWIKNLPEDKVKELKNQTDYLKNNYQDQTSGVDISGIENVIADDLERREEKRRRYREELAYRRQVLENLENQRSTAENAINRFKQDSKNTEEEIADIKKRRQKAMEDKSNVQSTIQNTNEKISKIRIELHDLLSRISVAEQTGNQEELKRLKEAERKLNRELEEQQRQLNNATSRFDNIESNIRDLEWELGEKGKENDRLKDKINGLTTTCNTLGGKINDLNKPSDQPKTPEGNKEQSRGGGDGKPTKTETKSTKQFRINYVYLEDIDWRGRVKWSKTTYWWNYNETKAAIGICNRYINDYNYSAIRAFESKFAVTDSGGYSGRAWLDKDIVRKARELLRECINDYDNGKSVVGHISVTEESAWTGMKVRGSFHKN